MNLKNNFDNVIGFKFPLDQYTHILENTKQPYLNGKKFNWKQHYIKSNGLFSDAVVQLYKEFEVPNINSFNDSTNLNDISYKLNRDGYVVIPNFLSNEEIESIKFESKLYEFYDVNNKITNTHPSEIKAIDNTSPLFYSNLKGSIIDPKSNIGRFISNKFFAEISWKYFGLNPYLCSSVYFYSPEVNRSLSREELKNSAQSYHFDYSHFKFLKFFLYLTDTDLESGAHTFIRGSHGSNIIYPKKESDFIISKSHENGSLEGQVKEDFINSNYSERDIIVNSYPKGALIIEDTSGLHKGGHVINGPREMISVLYSISNYGAYNPDTQPIIDLSNRETEYLNPISKSMISEQIRSFKKFNSVSFYVRLKNKLKKIIR